MKIEFKRNAFKRWEWHTWFAWYPVLTRWENGERAIIWLETVDRMYNGPNDVDGPWTYSPIKRKG